MFVYSNNFSFKKLPLKTKISLFLLIIGVLALLFVFGVTFLVLAIAGAILTFVVNLFGGRRPPHKMAPPPHPFQPPHKSPFGNSQHPRNRPHVQDDDVIDV